ncbi:MAG: formyl transferase [Alphaproteobacteria bacterium]|nr:formyl transferase [Alphaproteobacteria bacterium]
MRITLCTNNDLIGNIALNLLLQRLHGRHELSVILSDKVMGGVGNKTELAELQLLERDLPVEHFFPLLEAQPPVKGAEYYSFGHITQHYGVSVRKITNVNTGEDAEYFKSLKPDLVLSSRFAVIFKDHMLEVPTHGLLNFHSGPLPGYRGVMPTFRAMLNDAGRIGGTLHWIDPGIDTGEVVDMRYLPIQQGRSMFWNLLSLYPLGAQMMADAVDTLAQGKPLATQTQDETGQCYYSFPTEDDLRAFRDKGHKLVSREDYLEVLASYRTSQRKAQAA